MQQVTVSRIALIRALEKNRAKHKAVYDRAMAGYRRKLDLAYKRVIAAYRLALKKLNRGAIPKRVHPAFVNLNSPVEFLAEYDRAIGMLKLHQENTIKLSAMEYDHYIRDRWDWSESFTASNNAYVGAASKRSLRKVR